MGFSLEENGRLVCGDFRYAPVRDFHVMMLAVCGFYLCLPFFQFRNERLVIREHGEYPVLPGKNDRYRICVEDVFSDACDREMKGFSSHYPVT